MEGRSSAQLCSALAVRSRRLQIPCARAACALAPGAATSAPQEPHLHLPQHAQRVLLVRKVNSVADAAGARHAQRLANVPVQVGIRHLRGGLRGLG